MISLVIPVYNYENYVSDKIRVIRDFIKANHARKFEVIFVDDGSEDGTSERIKSIILEGEKLFIKEANSGKGSAVKEGVKNANGDYVVFTDADLPYKLDAILKIVDKIDEGFDVVIGSRHEKGSLAEVEYGVGRRILSCVFTFLANIILMEKISDTQCGIKGFNRQAASDIFSAIESNRFSFDVELLYLAQKYNYKVGVIPVSLVNHGNSSVKVVRDGFNMVYDLAKLYVKIKLLKK